MHSVGREDKMEQQNLQDNTDIEIDVLELFHVLLNKFWIILLTGMIAGLCGQHMPLDQAARLGVNLHGRAGDIAASSKGFHSMTASDVLNAIPELLKEITLD